MLNFCLQLRDIVRRNLNQIFNYFEQRKLKPETDLNFRTAPRVEVSQIHTALINLNIFTDGVNIEKSTMKKENWPVWVQITDPPPILRMARKNITLAALFVGSGTPDWSLVVPHLRAELLCPVQLPLNSDLILSIKFEVNLLIADLGAKSYVLNMFKFNGFFGCHYCTVKGKTIGRTHSYHPYEQKGEIREPLFSDIFVDFAESLAVARIK